jgi:hypothetical protein
MPKTSPTLKRIALCDALNALKVSISEANQYVASKANEHEQATA